LRQKVACNWLVGPLTTPPDLARHLRAHGFRCTAHDAGMACELEKPARTFSMPNGVVIHPVDPPPALLPLTTELRRLRYKGRSLLARAEPKQVWNFAASVKDRPVGETTLFNAAGIAGIYDVTVTEEFRRRGIGTALVATALDQARQLGLSIAILGATWMGQGMYERLGFRVVCKLSFWKYGKTRQLMA
jgi:GNAT superfamily N-acetyltransferase